MTMTGKGRRNKGVRGEREVAKLFESAGFDVRGLEGLGDHIATRGAAGALTAFHLETKRQERVRVPEWLRQCQAETPAGMVPLLAFRQNEGEWIAVLPLNRLLELLS